MALFWRRIRVGQEVGKATYIMNYSTFVYIPFSSGWSRMRAWILLEDNSMNQRLYQQLSNKIVSPGLGTQVSCAPRGHNPVRAVPSRAQDILPKLTSRERTSKMVPASYFQPCVFLFSPSSFVECNQPIRFHRNAGHHSSGVQSRHPSDHQRKPESHRPPPIFILEPNNHSHRDHSAREPRMLSRQLCPFVLHIAQPWLYHHGSYATSTMSLLFQHIVGPFDLRQRSQILR